MRVPMVRGRPPWSGVTSFGFFLTCLLTFTSPSVLKPTVVSSCMGVRTEGHFLVAAGVLGDLRVDLGAAGTGNLRVNLDDGVLGDPRPGSGILALPFVLRGELDDDDR